MCVGVVFVRSSQLLDVYFLLLCTNYNTVHLVHYHTTYVTANDDIFIPAKGHLWHSLPCLFAILVMGWGVLCMANNDWMC